MVRIIESKLDPTNEKYKEIIRLLSFLTKASNILSDTEIVDFINEETNNTWNTPQDIQDYIEALRSLIN